MRRYISTISRFLHVWGEGNSLTWADEIDYDPAMTHCIVASGGKTIVCIFVSAQGRQCLPDEASLNLALPIFSSCLNWATENRWHGSPRDRHWFFSSDHSFFRREGQGLFACAHCVNANNWRDKSTWWQPDDKSTWWQKIWFTPMLVRIFYLSGQGEATCKQNKTTSEANQTASQRNNWKADRFLEISRCQRFQSRTSQGQVHVPAQVNFPL